MKRGLAIFLQVGIVIFGMAVFAALLWEPQVEGRNVKATQFEIYFKDQFLAYIYLAFVPFFVGLYQAFKLVGYFGRDELFTERSVRAVRTIKYCVVIMAIFFIGAEAYILVFVRGTDDVAGGVMIGLFFIFVATGVGIAAAFVERTLQRAFDTKSTVLPDRL